MGGSQVRCCHAVASLNIVRFFSSCSSCSCRYMHLKAKVKISFSPFHTHIKYTAVYIYTHSRKHSSVSWDKTRPRYLSPSMLGGSNVGGFGFHENWSLELLGTTLTLAAQPMVRFNTQANRQLLEDSRLRIKSKIYLGPSLLSLG